jgi:hypothetical protein
MPTLAAALWATALSKSSPRLATGRSSSIAT